MSLVAVDGLLQVQGGGAVLGLRGSAVTDELIVSRENGQIQVLNTSSRCCVKSWQVSSSQRLSVPVVQHLTTRVYWGVVNHTELLSWRFSDSSLSRMPQELPVSIHTLLVSHGNPSPIVVLSDGTVGVAGEQMKAIKKKKIKTMFADVFRRDGCNCVCVVGSCEGVAHVTVWEVSSEGMRKVTTVGLDKSDLAGLCVCQDKLVAISAEGSVFWWSLSMEGVELVGSASLGDGPIRSLIASVSADHFVMYDGHSLLLWETSYMTQQMTLHVDDVTQLHSCGGCVCDGVRMWRVESGSGGLAAALGKRLTQSITPALSWHREACADSDVLNKLADRTKTPSLDTFMAEFSSCPLNSDLCYVNLVERLLTEKVFWAKEAIMTLMQAGVIPRSLSDRLLLAVNEHKDWELMVVCLQFVGGFSECVIVDLVEQFLINNSDGVDSAHRNKLLYLLLCQPFTDALLQQPLSQLKHTTVRELLQFLLGQLSVGGLLTCPPAVYNALLEWAGQVIDVHFTQLTFDPLSRDILAGLQRVIRDQVTCWSRLGVVRGVAEAWLLASSTPATNDWLYKVETLDVNI